MRVAVRTTLPVSPRYMARTTSGACFALSIYKPVWQTKLGELSVPTLLLTLNKPARYPTKEAVLKLEAVPPTGI